MGAPACFPWRPIRPRVGSCALGLLSQAGISLPSGFVLAEVHFRMSISVTFSPLRTTVIIGPRQVMVKRFHSPGFLTMLFVGARWPKIAPQCQLAGDFAHCSA